ncbi:MAG TPA: DUF5666 domain-containing protein [Chloroflexota bacterium]|nr:DUF5666 domain-containing protein [Chloroflexota bacterium]
MSGDVLPPGPRAAPAGTLDPRRDAREHDVVPLPLSPARRTGGSWLLLAAAGLCLGLLAGAAAAALSAPLRPSPQVAATPLQAGRSGTASGGAGEASEGGSRPVVADAPRGEGTGGGGRAVSARGGSSDGSRANGTISRIEGDTIIVATPSGPVQITLGDTTTVQKLVPAERSELAPGQRVTVSGARAADGTLAAESVQILGSDGPAGTPRGRGTAPASASAGGGP